ncbi:hypothetical protein [Cellulomonas terrae]|uniref:Uncharacterized protein n=1 Tax=Cellulomonas terrae TaxID=311234 RepID=A0A511JJP4_9CELL|nr:hypothetical protein [Cellulomonas terrae]GEL97863.1 hypothetical protein CTE05_14100 [Cellulomonas terrae]
MYLRGAEPGLTVERTDGVGFTAALYVRDRFGLQVGTDIPALTPPVPVRPSTVTVTQADWDGWWAAIEDSPPAQYVAPPPGSSLSALYDEMMDDEHHELVRWVQDQHWESSRVMRAYRADWLSPWIGASPARGRYVTETVPVTGPWCLSLTPRRLLVSVDLMRDHDAMDALWREQLTALEAP